MNKRQLQAYEHTDGPLLILAGAGSGKTYVLTKKITKLFIEDKISPSEVLALNFTKKAAGEMLDRVEQLLIESNIIFENKDLWIKTFDSFAFRIIEMHSTKLGYDENSTIFSESESKVFFTTLKNMHKLEINANALKDYVTRFLSTGIESEDFEKENSFIFSNIKEWEKNKNEIILAYSMYKEHLKAANAVDISELIFKVNFLFEKFPDISSEYTNKFKYVFIDEYQDTNQYQFELVKSLTNKPNPNIVVVGDDDQSIYGFRGADITNILSFEQAFSNTKVVKLEQNYRSSGVIVAAANALIKNNLLRKEKESFTNNDQGHNIRHYIFENENEEANKIAEEISNRVMNHESTYSDFAILFRNNSISKEIEQAFHNKDIPFVVHGKTNFTNSKEINDILSFLKVIISPDKDAALKRALSLTDKIGPQTIIKIEDYAEKYNYDSLFEVINKDMFRESLPLGKRNAINGFLSIIDDLKEAMKPPFSISDMIDSIIIVTNYIAAMKPSKFVSVETKLKNLQILQEIASEFDKWVEKGQINISDDHEHPEKYYYKTFLQHLNSDEKILHLIEDSLDRVKLMTIHGSKGLEFQKVFIVGFEEGVLPSSKSLNSDDMEEERRLAYVGITRAKKQLTLTSVKVRTQYGDQVIKKNPSIFFSEIKEKLIDSLDEYEFS